MLYLAFDFGILLSMNLIFYIILGLAILSGFLRGFKKSIFNLITMALFYIAFFLTINLMVGVLWEVDMAFLGPILSNVDPSLSGFTSFADSYESLAALIIGDQVDLSSLSSEAMELIMGLMQFILKIVWTILYFTVVLVIYKIICFIVRLIFFRNKDGNKNRLFGALIGAANGVMAVFITLVVLGGVVSVASSLVSITEALPQAEDSGNQTQVNFSYRDDILNTSFSVIELSDPGTEPSGNEELEEALDMLNTMVEEYNSNIFVKLADKITINSVIDNDIKVPLHINLFDTVLSFDYNENTVAFRYELMVLADALEVYNNSLYKQTNEITDLTGDDIRDITSILANSKLIVSLVPVAIEIMAEKSGETLPIEVEELYDGTIDYEEEIATLGRIAGSLFDILNGAGYIGGEGSLDQVEITPESVRNLFGEISGSDFIILLTDTLLLPMITDSEGDLALIIEVPEDINLETEFIAFGEIFAEIIDSDIDFEAISADDMTTTLKTLSSINLTVLLESSIVTEALINILSGDAGIEGLSFLEVPDDVQWKDEGVTEGELTKILTALNTLFTEIQDLDLNNLDIKDILALESSAIDDLFDSYLIRATITSMLDEMDFQDMSLIFPDSIYDSEGYLLKTELTATFDALKVLIDSSSEELSFDPNKVLNLTETEIDALFESQIIHATVGNYFNEFDTIDLEIPDSVLMTVQVDSLATEILTQEELTALLLAISSLNISDFDDINLENTSDILDNIPTLLESKIIHATISKTILDIGTTVVVPNKDVDNVDIITLEGTTTFITDTELENLFTGLELLNVGNPSDFQEFSFATLSTDAARTSLLTSAILHATISKQLLDLDDNFLLIPNQDELGTNLKVTRDTTTYIIKDEIKAIIAAMIGIGYTDVNDLNAEINPDDFIANMSLVLESSALQATVSKMIIDNGSSLIIPDDNALGNDLKIVYSDVTYIESTELEAFFTAIDELNISGLDFSSLSPSIDDFSTVDKNEFFSSFIMLATVSDYFLDVSLDETAAYGTTTLLIPSTHRVAITIDSLAAEVVEKTELINIIDAFSLLGLGDYNDSLNPAVITGLSGEDIENTLLNSDSVHLSINHIIWGNTNINTMIPDFREELALTDLLYNTTNVIIKSEIKNFIVAAKTVSPGSDITNVSFNYTTIASMSSNDRDIVLDSMIVQNILTDQLSALWIADPLYDPSPGDYHDSNTAYFLTEAGINSVLTNYGLI
jgi:hypothetical protein